MGLSPRGGSRPSRRQRTENAYRLVLVTGGSALATVVLLVLAIAGAGTVGLFFLFLIITLVAGFFAKKSVR